MGDYKHASRIEPVPRRWTSRLTCQLEDLLKAFRKAEKCAVDQTENGDSAHRNNTAPPGTRTPDPLIKSPLTHSPNPLPSLPLTNPTASVLPVCLPDSAQNDPDLALIVTSWEQLPEAVKTGIMAMVRAVEGR